MTHAARIETAKFETTVWDEPRSDDSRSDDVRIDAAQSSEARPEGVKLSPSNTYEARTNETRPQAMSAPFTQPRVAANDTPISAKPKPARSHLDWLESQSIEIMREVAAEFANPVLLYSIGKDSGVLLHLLIKAFYPAKPPMPLQHIDTGWKFKAMYQFRDQIAKQYGLDLRIHKNPDGLARGLSPIEHGAKVFTDVMKTQGLLQALNIGKFDAAIGGARRDEEASRAKERVFSFRSASHTWDPKNQRPELWNLYNTHIHKGESVRVFPLSNWTELDIWLYIQRENIPMVPLYFAEERLVVERDGTLIMLDDERFVLRPRETPRLENVRFRTLGCYPLTGAVHSNATNVPEIIAEMLQSRSSERQGRLIDHDASASMEKKKREGYF